MPKPTPVRTILHDPATIPVFATEAEEQRWWASHELAAALFTETDPGDAFRDLLPPVRPSQRRHSVAISPRLDPDVLRRLRTVAADRGMGCQTLIKQWIAAGLGATDTPAEAGAPTVERASAAEPRHVA